MHGGKGTARCAAELISGYKKFYEQKLAPIELPENIFLDEPTDVQIKDFEDVEDESPEEEEEIEEEEEDDFPFGF